MGLWRNFKTEACPKAGERDSKSCWVSSILTLRANFITKRSLNVEVSDCDSDCAGSSPAAWTNFNRGKDKIVRHLAHNQEIWRVRAPLPQPISSAVSKLVIISACHAEVTGAEPVRRANFKGPMMK